MLLRQSNVKPKRHSGNQDANACHWRCVHSLIPVYRKIKQMVNKNGGHRSHGRCWRRYRPQLRKILFMGALSERCFPYFAGGGAHRGRGDRDGRYSRRPRVRRGLRRQLHRVESSDVPRKGTTDRPPTKGVDETVAYREIKSFISAHLPLG